MLTIAAALLVVIGRGSAEHGRGSLPPGSDDLTRSDAEIATHLLGSVKGANAVVCAAVDRAFDNGYWGKMQLFMQPDINAAPEDIETAQWIGKRRLDRAVLAAARGALSSDDACTRRIGVRLVANVDVAHLDDELKSELASSLPATRLAAILALGYAEQPAAAARLRQFARESDRAMRVAAIWALGRIEDASSMDLMVGLLKNDSDPEVRRAAAWALGQFDH